MSSGTSISFDSDQQASSSTYTTLDAYLKEIPDLKKARVTLKMGALSGADRISDRAINRIVSPLDTIETLEEMNEALHLIEDNASKLNIFRSFQVNVSSMEFSSPPSTDSSGTVNPGAVSVTIDVECEEKKPGPTTMLGFSRNTYNQLEVDAGISIANLLGEGEQLQVLASANSKKPFKAGIAAHLPLLDYQGIKHVSAYCGFGTEASNFYSSENRNRFTHLQLAASLIGNHRLEWNYKKRSESNLPALRNNRLHSLSYKYFWDRTKRNPITGLRERGFYSDIECTMASFNSSPRFVKSRVSSHAYFPLKFMPGFASLHCNVAGLQPLHTDYSATNFASINESIHPADRLYTHVRGFSCVGNERSGSTSLVPEPAGGNFALNVEGKITMPLKFLNIFYDLTKIHGQAFIQAGNVIPLDFEKGDIERAQKEFVESARASYGIGAFIALSNLRFEVNYCRRLNLGSAPVDGSFSRLEFNIASEF